MSSNSGTTNPADTHFKDSTQNKSGIVALINAKQDFVGRCDTVYM
jgi:hypothetical protein